MAEKKAAKKTARKRGPGRTQGRRPKSGDATQDIVHRHDLTVHYLPIDDLIPYPHNPNIGGAEEAIDESLEESGQYRAVIVQRSTMYILAGNHTWEQLKKKGAKEIACHLFDVGDTEARRIVLGDNNIGKLANFSRVIEAELIAALPDHRGTGFSEEDFALMQRMAEEQAAEVEDVIGDDEEDMLGTIHRQALGGIDTPDDESDDDDSPTFEDEEEQEANDPGFDGVAEEMTGMFQLKEDTQFDSKHKFGIPPLRPDMFLDELPDNLRTWAGSATRDEDDPTIHWWWNFGVDSTSGMQQPLTQVIIGFYTHDDYFECWWDRPAKYVGKALNSQVHAIMSPNFSAYTEDPYIVNLWNLYRSRWVARYIQEAGIKIIPDLRWRGGPDAQEYIDRYMAYGLPKRIPVASIELQTSTEGIKESDAIAKKAAEEIEYAVEKCGVEHLLVYSGKPGKELMEQRVKLPNGATWSWLPNRSIPLGEKAKGRERKKTF